MVDLPTLCQRASEALPPYFFSTLAAAAFGAFAGAFINNRVQTRKTAVAELNSISAAMELCFSICNTSIGLKRQHVAPMRDAYQSQRKAHDRTVAADRAAGRIHAFFFEADLQTLLAPRMPTDLLERCVFDKISIRGRGSSRRFN